ncbi:phosphodiesterase [Shimia ponticola]|uniref:phosphodiesterase n=1 Tax=Shimia ponticola TaxID=2582893 RepID=UPI00164BA17F|nr:phosphodiesterase [Shimia ponticola]
MEKILVLTDPHIVPDGQRIIGIDPAQRLEDALSHALRTHPDASCLVLTGDLTHHGTAEEYKRLAAILAKVPIPVHMTLGNHDRRATFYEVFPSAAKQDGFANAIVPLKDATLVLLDTLDDPQTRARAHIGYVCDTRLRWLERTLAQHERVILAMHHHPAPVHFPGMDRIALENGQEVLDIARRSGAVAQMIFGHIHRTISGQMGGIPFSVFKSPAHQMPMDMQGTKSSSSVAEPGAYGIICVAADSIVVHTEDFDLNSAIHEDSHSA